MSIASDLQALSGFVRPDIVDFLANWEGGRGRYVADFRGRLDHIAEGLSVGGKKYATRFDQKKCCAQIVELVNSNIIAEIEVTGEAGAADWMTVRLVREQGRLQRLFESLLPDRVSVKIVDSL